MIVATIAFQIWWEDIFESDFDQLKLVKRMWFGAGVLVVFMLVITICEM